MNPHPRIRKTIKWGGAVVTVLLVVVWVGSAMVSVGRPTAFGSAWSVVEPANSAPRVTNAVLVELSDGAVWMTWPLFWQLDRHEKPTATWLWGTHHFRLLLPPYVNPARSMGQTTRGIALWPVILVVAGATGAVWRLDRQAGRRPKANLCPTCGYDRSGLNILAACPECGTF